ncbi:glutamine--tRNA ligase/YqeY domain fusion protein [Roseisolibacter sp. H3M3-2]|uniref:glutamine--tRNA ligase/YqeY domain fusion protein n=1 Tax=Roseisolibacter sp. H3M3-2 TaxID=3031323 RepID=UPI0023DA9972|nr:glutamine--tRNA ligase/YqeY domain fusion protein [Roseisolibacter sp. H3M3-2]MDF1503029.1 glutamine--tRNA ligase/YqeY domain fusion protein [Roseisolibacter sp. H3M3-2]
MSHDAPRSNFIRDLVEEDVATGRFGRPVTTRFPPEPNGYPHLGHVKSIVLNFGLARDFGGRCNLRFDDTNPVTEDMKYVEAMKADVRWLGYAPDAELYASDYFERLFEIAEGLVRDGKAYVDSQNEEQIREGRGTVTSAGTDSPYRGRSPEENLDLLRRMRAGEFPDGAHVLRAKIDMAHPNMVMRDPLLLRIRHAPHYRRGSEWCVYPLYDFAHGLSDAIEGITRSLCTLEFKDGRDIYEWLVREAGFERPPTQIEFARLELEYTVLSKRKLLRLVNEGHVSGWDDPRMPTIAGIRRRGVTPEALRNFAEAIGVARKPARTELATYEHYVRDDLNMRVPRRMAVLKPLKVVLTNYPEGQVEELEAPSYPHDVPLEGSRPVPFSRELWIERDDFMEEPPKKFFRLAPGREVRLRYAYFITCQEVVKDADGTVVELRCTYDPATRGGDAPDGRKVQGTIHWVSAARALDAEVRLYERLFSVLDPEDVPEGEDFTKHLNPDSLVVVRGAKVEPSLRDDPPGSRYQFERTGYFVSDAEDSRPDAPVFNRTVGLRDSWAKVKGS